jgi:hypothetical protein
MLGHVSVDTKLAQDGLECAVLLNRVFKRLFWFEHERIKRLLQLPLQILFSLVGV